ncbi:hypothetical protein R1T08_03190 [Streptomyces sp. SBC-4]|nr:hypothetical protein [Streptomyces sp. SBC-4]MDV5143144.1 hypothetical protein [Streptomyces sp. SBC-4]MDV5143336.1 hypothetical protein [Streptomyces sp. SBC-4]
MAVVGGVGVRVSRVRARQLWMVVGMWERALCSERLRGWGAGRVEGLFDRRVLEVFWDLACAGELRALEPGRGRERVLPVATLRVVRDCLGIMAGLVVPEGVVVSLPVVEQPEPKAVVRAGLLGEVYRGLVELAAGGPLEREGKALSFEDRTRLLALVCVVLDTGARSGELAALRLDDVADGRRAVGLRRRQQKAPPNRAEEIAELAGLAPSSVRAVLWGGGHRLSDALCRRVEAARDQLEPLPDIEWYALRPGTRIALRRWLEVRERLVEPLQGGRSALWVTLVPTKAGPPGITLRPQGLTQAFARGMTALNWVMAGRPGWEPMPTRMEQLRRAITPEPLPPRATGK